MNKLKKLDKVLINGKSINYFETSSGDIRFDIDLTDVDYLHIEDNGIQIPRNIIGLEIVDLQDASGSYAYHIPEGILLYFKPNSTQSKNITNKWEKISVLDFAPSLINYFQGCVPSYMSGYNKIFNP